MNPTTHAVGDRGLSRDAVPAAFDRGAASYDRLVGVNPGYHAHLRLSARRLRLPDDGRGLHLLDAGCGTGASTAALVTVAPHARITAVDASAGMLARAREKHWPPSVRFVHARVEDLADVGVTGPFDAIFAAYLVRNLTDPDRQLRAFHDLLRPGGRLAVHEYSVRDSRRARALWTALCWGVIVPAGGLATGETLLYRHLWRSVRAFDGVESLRRRLAAAGFTAVRSYSMPGWQRGVVHTFLGTRPLTDAAACHADHPVHHQAMDRRS